MTEQHARFTADDAKKKWFVTGGAGFIGSHVVDLLVSAGCQVTVFDDLSLSSDHYIAEYVRSGKITFIQKNLLDLDAVIEAMKGHDIVWHLAANTDIPSGFTKHRIDLDNDVIVTWNVLEAMVKTGVKQMLFSSTGAVYGESIEGAFKESSGPLIPVSLYGAGKIASEAFISAYCGLFGLEVWMFRFGNVIGGRTTHGIIFDFIAKLKKSPTELEVLGTGKGEKNYFLAEDCIQGMLFTHHRLNKGPFPVLVNLGTDSTSKIMDIAKIIIEEMCLEGVKFRYTGTPRGWPGDQPVVLLDTTKIHELGWWCKRTSDDAVRIATRRVLGTETFLLTTSNL
jgi:UDP-glucose 4-epimerase